MINRKLSRRGVSMVISGLLLIAVTVTGCVLYYSYSMKLLGTLLAPSPQMMDNLRIEAYNWNSPNLSWVNVTLRNIGANVLTISSAQWFVAGVLQANPAPVGCGATLNANGASCTEKITLSGVTAASGIVYVIKIVLSDGSIFATSAIAGEVTGQTGVT